MHTEEHIEIEARGVKSGINPMFGAWQQQFHIEPVSYQNKRDEKNAFRTAIQSLITQKYVFWGEVRVGITLYLNEQKAEENPRYGDLDNYAKQILDSIKGSNGIIIDDCQVQTFSISWIDVPGDSHFEVSIEGRPDEFCQKPLKLYEMPDSKFYPISSYAWTREGLIETSPENIATLLRQLEAMIRRVKTAKHEFRKTGAKSIEAYRSTKCLLPCLLGFHKSSVIDSGFDLVRIHEWASEV